MLRLGYKENRNIDSLSRTHLSDKANSLFREIFICGGGCHAYIG